MFVYLDESGDTGFKFSSGSSTHFVVALLMVEDPVPLHSAIDDVRREFRFPDDVEFKFAHSSNRVREHFLRMLVRFDIRVRAIVIDKRLMTAAAMHRQDAFYRTVVRLVLQYDFGSISGATLVVDESVKSKQKKRELATYLRRELNSEVTPRKIRTIKYHRSDSDNLLQAVDMVAGAIHREYNQREHRFSDIIRRRIDDCWEWRPS